MGISLFHHNREAYEAALFLLSEKIKAAIIHPTGTGKYFIGFKLSEDFPDSVIFRSASKSINQWDFL